MTRLHEQALCMVLALAASVATAQTTYSVRLLPKAAGSTEAYPLSVNDFGYVGGQANVSISSTRAALWDPAGNVTLWGSPLHASDKFWYTSVTQYPLLAGKHITTTGDRGFLLNYETGAVTYFSQKLPSAMNSLNELVLTDKWDPSGTYVQVWNLTTGYRTILGLQGTTSDQGNSLNNAGEAVGVSVVGGVQRPWVHRNNTTVELPGTDSTNSASGRDINEHGFATGGGRVAGVSEAILWAPDLTYTLLGRPAAHQTWTSMSGTAINDHGTVVGDAFTGSSERAWVWTSSEGTRMLQDIVDASGNNWVLTNVRDINNRGQIVGYGSFNGEQAAFILDPTTLFGPNSFSVFRGGPPSGGLSDILASDDSKLIVRAGLVLFPSESPLQLVFEGSSPTDLPSELRFKVEASVNTPGLSQTIEMFNFDTGQYEVMDISIGPATDMIVQVVVNTNQTRFLEDGTGKVRAKVSYRRTGLTFVWPWSASIDHVQWRSKT